MHIEAFQEFCLSLPEVTEEFPFGPDTLVYKVRGKMFALTNLNAFESINLKCDPEEAIELRERYPAVTPGYHMNKKHWNTVALDNTIKDSLLYSWIRASYDLVLSGMPKRK
ncbi:MmcQ/YjbR family DNA-binding protein [Flavihumibacter fluvii]|uniref:MmcQ/YjbR family DNA-binding protein n=1 Tax=Flavihumibacter fluvii TaxID=2838157 RepID=UPI001BDDE2F6|nr:MmcQ/YjbR family DNA-binding protein [Flavihumibacter fluvii]ULQ54798.1 MmcQ/YjbR family DNA-binding protein [Flavihumibacter fluvii]